MTWEINYSDLLIATLKSRGYRFTGNILSASEFNDAQLKELKEESARMRAASGYRLVWVNNFPNGCSEAFAKSRFAR
ncbi:MAG: hypothetical protein AABX17_04095 [Nanoarchaeota archaeon]